MAQLEEQLIQFLQDALGTSGKEKTQALASAKELLVYKLSDKMETYFPMLLEFQLSQEAVVKQTVVEAVLECVGAVPRLDFLTAATGCVRHMLNDAFPSVVKAALVATKDLVALSLHALCNAKLHERGNAEAQWRALGGVLETVTGPRLTSHKNQAVRMLTVKLLELVTLMTSASHCPSVKGRFQTVAFARCPYPGVDELRRASQDVRTKLTALAKPSALRSTPVTVQIVLLMTLASLSLQRPELAHGMVSSLLLAVDSIKSMDVKDANSSKGRAAAASLRKCCQDALLVILKSEDPVLMQQEQRVYKGLSSLQAEPQASEAIKRRNTALQKAERANDRGASQPKDERPTKRQDVKTEPTAMPVAADPARAAMADKVARVAAQVPKLLCRAGLPGVLEFIGRLDSDTLIELVLSRMAYLPAHSPPADATIKVFLDAQIAACKRHVEATAPAPAPASTPAAIASAPAAAPEVKPEPVAAILEPTPPPSPPAARPRPRVRVPQLSAPECEALRGAAIRRILAAPATLAPTQRLRTVAKLAPAANSPEGQELLRGFTALLATDQEAALELAISWLYSLFLNQCRHLQDPARPGHERATTDAQQMASVEAAQLYLSALESAFETLYRACGAADRMPVSRLPPVTVLITQVPLLPEGVVRRSLEFLCRLSPAWGKVALLTMRELIKSKHTLKPVMLQLAIEQLLRMRDAELRSGTMRMLANQVYPVLLPEEATALEDAAVKLISDFAEHKPAAPTDPDDAELLARYRRDMARSAEGVAELFKMLCAKRPQLLHRFCNVYLEEGQDPDVKAAILGGVEKVGAMLSADSPAVLDLVQSSPAAAAPVMLHFLRGALTRTGGVPPPPLVDAALAHYERSQDVQLLALIMPGMPLALALQNVAHLVRMPRDAFLAAIRNVVHAPDGRAGVLNPRELLIQLHLLDPQAVNVELRHLGLLVTGCIRMKELFSQEDVTSVLSQLMNRQPLPPLIMRTLINVWQVHADSRRYLVKTIAEQLLTRRIYEDTGSLWSGFAHFCSYAINSASVGPLCDVLLRLPPARLEQLLQEKPMADQSATAKLADYVSRLTDRVLDTEVYRVLGIEAAS